MEQLEGTKRVVIENVKPQINCGRFPAKRVVGEEMIVTADIFADGHDEVKAQVIFRNTSSGQDEWTAVQMEFLGNDRWETVFTPEEMGQYAYTIEGWIDHFYTWQKGLKKKFEAGQDVGVELLIGAELIEGAAGAHEGELRDKLYSVSHELRNGGSPINAVALATGTEVSQLMAENGVRDNITTYEKVLKLNVERKKALFSSWYEFFPRSTSQLAGQHGTFKDCERLLPRIAEMGFDTIYLPPIHPIGYAFRKGKNNNPTSQPGEPGSPWAIGAAEGGHDAILPELGTLEDFRHLVQQAKEHGIEIALDFAIQCSQDHPYVKEHPQWFKWRPDGTVQYAENPPKNTRTYCR
ncbi:hypothetical protein GCM10028895_48600 [Pontibacter rugosus]